MSRSRDITWEHCTKVDSTGKVQCTYCGKMMSKGVTRMKQHLGGIVGEVIACDKVPPQVKLYFKDLVEKGKGKKKAKLEQEGVRSGPADEDLDKGMKISIRLSRQAAMEERRREMMRSGPGSGSRSDAGYIKRSNAVREQARIDRREKVLRRYEEEDKDIMLAKRLSVQMDEKKKTMLRAMKEYEERKKKKTLIAKFFRGIEKFYGSIGIKYKSSHKESLKEFAKIIREEDKDPSPPSSDDVNVVIEGEGDSSSDDGSDWGESYNR